MGKVVLFTELDARAHLLDETSGHRREASSAERGYKVITF